MELRARVEKLTQLPAPTAVPPVTTPSISRLVSLEHDQMTHRWFRGVMSFLAFICFILSIFQVENRAGNIAIHVIILVLSLAAEVCLVFIYRIKARFAGVSNPASRVINPLHSPYASMMVAEMLLWIIMAPPGVSSRATWAQVCDSLIILRSYVYVLYFTQLTTQSVFKRAVATVCGYRFNSFYLFRNTFLSRHGFVTAIGFVVALLALALLYSKGEAVSYLDAIYFCFSTTAFVAYGDFSPTTWVGRFAAFLSWCLGLLMIGWSVSLMHALLKVSPAERNLYTLFRTNKLCAQMPGEAARTIQRAWKLYVAKRDKRNQLSVQFNALLLSSQACSFRNLRRELTTAEVAFLRSTYTFEDTLTAMSRHSSRRSSPAGSPRSPATGGGASSFVGGSPRTTPSSRRPFSLFKDVKAKPSSTGISRATSGAEMSGVAGSANSSTSGVPHRSTAPSQLDLRHANGGAEGVVASPSVTADMTARLSHLDETLNALIHKAERLAPSVCSLTEVAS